MATKRTPLQRKQHILSSALRQATAMQGMVKGVIGDSLGYLRSEGEDEQVKIVLTAMRMLQDEASNRIKELKTEMEIMKQEGVLRGLERKSQKLSK